MFATVDTSCAAELDDEDSDGAKTYWRLRDQYPTCVHQDRTGDFSARKRSDFLTQRELRRLEIYADLFRPEETEYQIAVGLSAPLTHTEVFLFNNGARRLTTRLCFSTEPAAPTSRRRAHAGCSPPTG